jgi:NADPH:quinone reductase-like Zn-dependent oxidoreductase
MESLSKRNMNHAVRYDHFGDASVYYIAELPKPVPGKSQLLVKVKTAGINPGESYIREGRMAKIFPSTFPSGQGTDFAGIVELVGSDVKNFKSGDEVIGYSHERSSQAEYVAVEAEQVVLRPANVSWEAGGGLFVAGTTAYAAVRAVDLHPGETVIVSGAAGGVGSIAVQLAKGRGATVIGIASESNHQWLKNRGIIPANYNDDLVGRLNEALGGKRPDAFIDLSGKGYVEMAIKLGIARSRINTIIDFEAAERYDVKTEGSAAASTKEVLQKLVSLISEGMLEIPIGATYPLAQVKEAYQELEKRHTHGKIVLTM